MNHQRISHSLRVIATAMALLIVNSASAVETNQVPSSPPQTEHHPAPHHRVRKHHPRRSDSWITTKVKSKLFASQGVPGHRISVKTIHGTVHLTGHVSTKAERERAISLTRHIEGVKKVEASALSVAHKTQ